MVTKTLLDLLHVSKVTFFDDTINVTSTDGWMKYGLLKINDEIISYTGKTKTSFTGCSKVSVGLNLLIIVLIPKCGIFLNPSHLHTK